MKNINIIIIIIIISYISLINGFFNFVKAVEPDSIVFTEIMYDLEGSDDGKEWVEIYNKGEEAITIVTGSGYNSWRFNDGSNHILNLFQGEEIIEATEIAIIADNGQTFIDANPSFTGTIFETSMSLGNITDTISLSADSGQTFFNEVIYESGWGAAGNGMTLEKIDFLGDETAENWQESFVLGGSPGQVSSQEPENQPPVAEAGEDQTTLVGQIVYFDGSLSHDPDEDPLTYLWDFGDNNFGEGVTTTYNYMATGTFVVTLTVSDGEFEDYDELIIEVLEPENQPPVAAAGNDLSGYIGDLINFNGSLSYDLDNDPLLFTWDFNDNQVGYGVTTTHIYQEASDYLVTLFVSDGQATSTDTLLVSITEEQLPPAYSYSNILINEFLPNPEGSDDNEWLELYNNGSEIINLEGLKIQDNSNTIYTINNEDFLTTYLNPYSYFVVERTVSNIALNNSGGDCLNLFSPANELLNNVCYQETASEGLSYAKKSDNSWGWTYIITKGSQNQFPVIPENQLDEIIEEPETNNEQINPVDYNNIIISEFLPNPEGSDSTEFIEIYNNGQSAVNILDLQIDDQEGGSSPFTIKEEITIYPQTYLVFYQTETKVVLNNSSDSVRLIDNLDEVLEMVEYQDPQEGFSYNYDPENQVWLWSVPTPGEANITDTENNNIITLAGDLLLEQDDILEPQTISQIRELDKGLEVIIYGAVTVLPGIFGESVFYVSEINIETQEIILESGIQIYNIKKDFPNLKLGDIIEIYGTTSESRGEKRIKTKTKEDVAVIDNINLPQPFIVSTSEVSEELEGGLVSLEGEILDKKKMTLVVGDDSGEVKIYLKKTTKLDFNELEEGYIVVITGIVSETTTGYRLLPRYAGDIEVGTIISQDEEDTDDLYIESMEKKVNFSSSDLKKYLIISLGALVLIACFLVIKLKVIKIKKLK